MKKIQNNSGSILVTTIMILSIVLVTTLSMVFVSNIGHDMSVSSNDSLVAYQRADTGIEKTLAVIVAGYTAPNSKTTTVGSIANRWDSVGTCDTVTGKITRKISEEKIYTIQLMKRHDATSTIMDSVGCNVASTLFSEITIINSVGIVPGKTQRAVSADVPRAP
jgi:Tfp pilus assembly protein PilX